MEGFETDVDYPEALRFLSTAAAKGASRALANLARMYATGLGVPTNVSEAVKLYRAAAERGEFVAQIELGRIFSRGQGVEVDPEAALRWFSAAAAQEGRVEDGEELRSQNVHRRTPLVR